MDPHAQHLLQQLALLPEITAPLARALTHDDGAFALVEQLARRNYFTQRHASVEAGYQFHPLFKTFLQTQVLHTTTPEQLAQLQLHATRLLLEWGRIEDAAGMLCEARDWTAFAQLIATHGPLLARQGRLQTLVAWVVSIPEEVREQAPWLLY